MLALAAVVDARAAFVIDALLDGKVLHEASFVASLKSLCSLRQKFDTVKRFVIGSPRHLTVDNVKSWSPGLRLRNIISIVGMLDGIVV